MVSEEVIDAVEEILREEGVYDEIRKSLFLAVSSVVAKKKPIKKASKVKEFSESIEGKLVMQLIVDLFVKLGLNNSLEIFGLESGFSSNSILEENLKEKYGGLLASTEPFLLQIISGTAGGVKQLQSTGEEKLAHISSSPNEKREQHTQSKKRTTSHGSPPGHFPLDMESSYEADDKSTSSLDKQHFSFHKESKKGTLSPLGPSPPKKKSLVPLTEHKNLSPLEPLLPSNRNKVKNEKDKSIESDNLSHNALLHSSRKCLDSLDDSFEKSIEEKLEESRDKFEISSSFEHSDANLKFEVSPQKQTNVVLAPLADMLSPSSIKSEKEGISLDQSQPEELNSASFLEESDFLEPVNMMDDENSVLLDSPKKSASSPCPNAQHDEVKDTNSDPATEDDGEENHIHVNTSTASTVRTMRSQIGWNNEAKDRQDDNDYEFSNLTHQGRVGDDTDVNIPGRGCRNDKSKSNSPKQYTEEDYYDDNSAFESIEDLDDISADKKSEEKENDYEANNVNASYTNHRNNQEEDEEDYARRNASVGGTDVEEDNQAKSLFSFHEKIKSVSPANLKSPNKKKSLDDTDDNEDEYGDDFDDDFENDEEIEELDESIAESLEEDFDGNENSVSFGSKNDESSNESEKDRSYMSSPTQSPKEKLPSLFTKSTLEETKISSNKNIDSSMDSDPFQDKSGSFDEGVETSVLSKDDLEDFSVGAESSDGDEFLKDEDDESASAQEFAKDQRSVGRLGESNDFSMSEHEISGSHNLNEFGADYTTTAAPPTSRRGGW